jgi:hypothetical protein
MGFARDSDTIRLQPLSQQLCAPYQGPKGKEMVMDEERLKMDKLTG